MKPGRIAIALAAIVGVAWIAYARWGTERKTGPDDVVVKKLGAVLPAEEGKRAEFL